MVGVFVVNSTGVEETMEVSQESNKIM